MPAADRLDDYASAILRSVLANDNLRHALAEEAVKLNVPVYDFIIQKVWEIAQKMEAARP